MKLSKVFHILFNLYMSICFLLGVYYVIIGLASNFENTKDYIFVFVFPAFIIYHLREYIEPPYKWNLCVRILLIAIGVFFGLMIISSAYLFWLSLLGCLIPITLVILTYYTEEEGNNGEYKQER